MLLVVHFSSPLLIDVHGSFDSHDVAFFTINHFIPLVLLLVLGSLFVHGVELPLRIILRFAGFIPFSILLFVLGFVFFYESFCVYDFEYSTMVLLTLTILFVFIESFKTYGFCCFSSVHLSSMALSFIDGSLVRLCDYCLQRIISNYRCLFSISVKGVNPNLNGWGNDLHGLILHHTAA